MFEPVILNCLKTPLEIFSSRKFSSPVELSFQVSLISVVETAVATSSVGAATSPGGGGGGGGGGSVEPPWLVNRATAACRRPRSWPWTLPRGAPSPAAAARATCTI